MAITGQGISLIERRELLEALMFIFPTPRIFLDLFFTDRIGNSTTQLLEYDVFTQPRTMSQFTARNSRTAARSRAGFEKRMLQIPYIKEAREVTPETLRRTFPGVSVYDTLSKADALERVTGNDLSSMQNAILRRMEYSAIQQLVTGQLLIKSDTTTTSPAGVPVATSEVDAVIDILQLAANRVTLVGSAAWSDAVSNGGLNIENSIMDGINQITSKTGLAPTHLFVGWNKFMEMRKVPQVRSELNQTQPTNFKIGNIDLSSITTFEATKIARKSGLIMQVGTYIGMEVWLYHDYATGNDGTAIPMFPLASAMLGCAAASGAVAHGALEVFEDVTADAVSPDGYYPTQVEGEENNSIYNKLEACAIPIMREPNAFYTIS
jgi:Phage major capsid protein E